MESWQKTFIRKNLPRFIEETIVNDTIIAFLLADDIIGDADVQKLEAGGNMAKAKVLYDQLFTRTSGYKGIGKATFEAKQSGAFLLLLKGLVERLLQQSNINLEDELLDEILKADCLRNESYQFFSAKVDKGTLYEDSWIAAHRSLYIPRYISNRIKLNSTVFKEECSDIFVFIGITRLQLSKLAKPNRTATSSQVILKKITTIRFVLLEHEHHWNKLRSAFNETPIHLIQLERNSSDFILQNSTQPSKMVSNHIPPHLRDKSLYLPEEQFLTQISNEKNQRTICICDTPGMGKTWLLENLARQIQQREPGRMIAVIGLQNFVERTQAFTQHPINSSKPLQVLLKHLCPFNLTSTLLERGLENNQIQLELFLDGFDEVPNKNVQTTQEFITSLAENRPNVNLIITSRPHMRSELEKTLKGVAYDILPFSEENQADFLVRFWKQFAERPEELNSDKLRLFAQECLKCFKEDLTWEEMEMMGIPLQCLLLATVTLCHAELYCHRDNNSDITEFISPTSLYDMYTIYFQMGIDRAVGSRDNYKTLRPRGNFSLSSGCPEEQKLKAFHVWVALKLLIPDFAGDYRIRESIPDFEPQRILACGILQNCSSDNASPTEMNMEARSRRYSRYKSRLYKTEKIEEECDILNKTMEPLLYYPDVAPWELTFVHRTFAEYLVADHFAEIMTSSCKSMNNATITSCISYFVTNILSTRLAYRSEYFIRISKGKMKFRHFEFRNSTIVYFFNASLQSKQGMSTFNLVSQNIMHLLSAENFPEILSACITCNYDNIIRLFKNLLKPIASEVSLDSHCLRRLVVSSTDFEESIDEFSPDQYYWSVRSYLCQAAEMSNVNVLDELYSFFEECLHENLNEFCSGMSKDDETPLHFAVRREDYSIVEYFASQFTLSGRRILFSFTKGGHHVTEAAIQICELLVGNDTSIILEKNEDNTSIILHVEDVELIKYLVEQGADIRDTVYNNIGLVDTILTINAYRFQEDEFCELCRYLINDIKAYDLFSPNLPFWSDPLPKIIGKVDDDTLISISQVPGISTQQKFEKENNLVLDSINKKRRLSTIKRLEELGVDLFAKNIFGENALHLAVKSGNFDTVEYLLSRGFNLEGRDNGQKTALHHAAENIKMIKFLILKNSNVLATNKEDENIAHLALKLTRHESNKKDMVLYFMSLREGAELFKMTNQDGRTPLREYIAKSSIPDSETMELILSKHEEDVNASDSEGYTMFLHAAHNNNSEACLKILKKFGANHNATNRSGMNALHLSAKRGFLKSTKYLVSIGLPLELQDNHGNTPLLAAAEFRNVNVMNYLISHHANIFAVNNDGNSIAHSQLRSAFLQYNPLKPFVEYLLKLPQGPQLFKITNQKGRTPLHERTWLSTPDSETIELMLQNSGEDVNATDSDGWTMFLYTANYRDSVACLKCLIMFGANENVTTPHGRNALHISAEKGFLESTKYLLSIGLSVEQRDNEGNTPLLVAAYSGKIDMIKYMLSQNANVLAVNNDGNNIAHLVFLSTNHGETLKSIVEYLLTLPQAPKLFLITNKSGRTPLHEWIANENSYSDSETVELILQTCGEDVNATDYVGLTMFQHAANHGYSVACLKTLKKFGANHNVTDTSGRNALHISATKASLELTKYSVSVGLSVELQDSEGNTPLLLAANLIRIDIMKYLISQHANVLAVNNDGNNIAHIGVRSTLSRFLDGDSVKRIVEDLLTLPETPQLFKMTNKKDRTPLHELIANWRSNLDSETIELILKKSGEDVNATDVDGFTMFLHAAYHENSVACLKTLKKFGANHNVTHPSGYNALHISTTKTCLESVKLLVSIGVSLELQTKEGFTPLLAAVYYQKIDMIKYMISHNADVLAVTNCGSNCVHLAFSVKKNKESPKPIVEYFLTLSQAPQLFKMKNHAGRTPLHNWIANMDSNPDSDTMELILENSGEDVNATDSDGWTMFLRTAYYRDSVACLKCLKEFGANENVTTQHGRNALHCAAEKGFLESTKYLLSIGLSVEQRDNKGNTPLLLAAYFQKADVIKYLISQNADILAVNIDGSNCVHLALSSKEIKESPVKPIVEFFLTLPQAPQLFKMKNKTGSTPLHKWIANEDSNPDLETLELIFSKFGEEVNTTDSDGFTMFLQMAYYRDSVACLKCLKKFGANENVTIQNGSNALHIAAEKGFLETTKFLVSIGVSLELQNNEEYTPLLDAAYFKKIDIIKYMISQKADILAVNTDGCNCVHLALSSKENKEVPVKPIVEYFLALPQAPQLFKMKNKTGSTPLHEWIANEDSNLDSDILELILENSGEDVNATDSDGWTMFLHTAYYRDSVACLKCLKEFGANENVTTQLGRNALHIAAEQGFLESTKYLLSIGLSVEQRDNEGNTPLLLAAYFQRVEVIKYLISRNADILAVNTDGCNCVHFALSSKEIKESPVKPIVEFFLALPQAPQLFKMKNHTGRTPLHNWIAIKELNLDSDIVGKQSFDPKQSSPVWQGKWFDYNYACLKIVISN